MNDNLQVIETNNQRVLTTAQIAERYETSTDLIQRNFSRNKERYTEGRHYYCLVGDALREFKATGQIDVSPNLNKFYLWTEKRGTASCKEPEHRQGVGSVRSAGGHLFQRTWTSAA